jgi:hypothetical protein
MGLVFGKRIRLGANETVDHESQSALSLVAVVP